MTRNLYLGAVLDPIIAAPNSGRGPRRPSGDIYKNMQDMNFTRARSSWRRRSRTRIPTSSACRKSSIWRRDERRAADGATTPSTGGRLRLPRAPPGRAQAARARTTRSPRPAGGRHRGRRSDRGGDDDGPSSDFERLTMQDVILAKKGVKVERAERELLVELTVPVQGAGTVDGPARIQRGRRELQAVKKKKQKFQFVNTHLESFFAYAATHQAKELDRRAAGPLSRSLPIILLGDLNSDPADPRADPGRVQPRSSATSTTRMTAGSPTSASRRTRAASSETLFDDPPVDVHLADRPRARQGRGLGGVSSALIGDDPAQPHRHRPVADRPRRGRRDAQGRLAT